MRENFEMDAIFLAPTCPVAKKQGNNEVAFYMTISANDSKNFGRGKMGMELQYHKKRELLDLPQDQKYELVAYNATNDGRKWKGASGKPGSADSNRNSEGKVPSPNKNFKTMISYMIAEATNKREQPSTQDEISQYILDMVSSIAGATEKKKGGNWFYNGGIIGTFGTRQGCSRTTSIHHG